MKQLLTAFITFVAASQVLAAGGDWLTNLDQAKAKAKQQDKLIFMEFTGSDWCPPCKALHKNILSTKEFLDYAKKNLILVELDFPRRKSQSDELKKANRALAKEYKIEGYPTVIILSSAGKELKRQVGYGRSSTADMIAMIEKLK